MKRFLVFSPVAFLALSVAFAQNFDALDALHDTRNFSDEIAGLKKLYNAADPQAAGF